MSYSSLAVYIIEMIGTVAFASSGAMIAIRKNMDIFGINVLAVTTALGGGLIRDLVLGINPPNMFRNSSYALAAIVTACLLFGLFRLRQELLESRFVEMYEKWMNVMDAIGLGAFTVIGINTALGVGYDSIFLLIFVGVITGIGGGMIRDVMAGNMPFVFVKHVYACASIAGAILCLILRSFIGNSASMIIAAVLVVVIRLLAAHYRWNLPRVQ
ncbi:MAG: TRIC cation channel family protein [Clostridiales bacterium]|nr:TRIC cation channel family protein [Clostridiales bacterium]